MKSTRVAAAQVRIGDVMGPGFHNVSRDVFTIVPPDQSVITRVEPERHLCRPSLPRIPPSSCS